MRWKQPVNGERRVYRQFLLFPKTLGFETRWLEWATIVQEYTYWGQGSYLWTDIEWDD